MWVDQRFLTHYHAWNIKPLAGIRPDVHPDDESECWNEHGPFGPPEKDLVRQDVFAVGFCRWLERDFQQQLLGLKPTVAWKAKGGDWPMNFADPSIHTLNALETPCVVHTEWADGSVYARVLSDNQWTKVLRFARRRLGLKIKKVTA